VIVFLTFDLIVFGAFTRLTDSGLGCPDWPGCYGEANPFLAHEQIAAAEALMPTGPVTGEGLDRDDPPLPGDGHRRADHGADGGSPGCNGAVPARARPSRLAADVLFLFVCVQGAFGAWTVTMKLQPVIVTMHLLLGMGLLALLAWLGGREDYLLRPPPAGRASPPAAPPAPAGLAGRRRAAGAAGAGRVGEHQLRDAGLHRFPAVRRQACPGDGLRTRLHLWRELGKTAAGHYLPFSALTAIHWVHRNFAARRGAGAGLPAWRAWRLPACAHRRNMAASAYRAARSRASPPCT
jgi:cytochrome c oxidase assembly protein subunit 15